MWTGHRHICVEDAQTYLLFRAAFADGDEKHQAGNESLETRMVSAAEVPWDEVRPQLYYYFSFLRTYLYTVPSIVKHTYAHDASSIITL